MVTPERYQHTSTEGRGPRYCNPKHSFLSLPENSNIFIHPFIQLLNKYLLHIYNVLEPESTSVNIIVKIPIAMKFTF